MAFYKVPVNSNKVVGSHTDKPFVLIPSAITDFPSLSQAEADSVRIYLDEAKTNEIAREIRTSDLIFFNSDLDDATSVYIDYDGQRSDYADDAQYGAENVWPDFWRVAHNGGAEDVTENNVPGSEEGGLNSGDVTGSIGPATSYDGGEQVGIPYPEAAQSGGNARSHSALIYITANGNLIQYGTSSNNSLWRIELRTDSGGHVDTPFYFNDWSSDTGILPTEEWILIDVVYDGADVFYFANGVAAGSGDPGTLSTSDGFYDENIGGDGYEGNLAEHWMFNGAYSSDYVTTKANCILDNGSFWGTAIDLSPGPISGTVTLNGSPVQGATVRCIRQSDNTAIAEETTDSNGDYTFSDLSVGEKFHLAVEYSDGGQDYNALSLWDVEPV